MASSSVLIPILLTLGAVPEPRRDEICTICGKTPILHELEALLLVAKPDDQARILRALGETHSPLARATLRASLTSSIADVRRAAIDGLVELGPFQSTEDLLVALQDGDDGVAIHAARALGKLPLPVVRTRLSALANDRRRTLSIRSAAIEGLFMHRTREAWRAADALRDADSWLGEVTAQRRSEITPPCRDCNEPLVSQALSELLASTDVAVRVDAVSALGELRPVPRGLALLNQVAERDQSPLVRIAALDRIATSSAPSTLELLVHGTDDRELEVRRRAVEHIATSTRSDSVPALVDLSEGAPFDDVRALATTALSYKPEALAVKRLEAVLVGREPKLIRVVLIALSESSTVAMRLVDAALPVAVDPSVDFASRELALTLAARGHHPGVSGALLELALGSDAALARRSRDLLERYFPTLFAEYERNLPAVEAKIAFVASSGVFAGTTFSLLARIRDDSAAASILSAAGGFALGAGSAYLIGSNDDLYGGPVAVYATSGAWGLIGGLSVPMVLGGEPWPSYSRHLGGAIGTALGTTVGAFALHDRDWSIGDAALINTSGIEAGLGTLGVVLLPGREGDPLQAGGAVLLGGLALGVIPASFFAQSIEMDTRKSGSTAALATSGAWLGLWGSRIATGSERASQSFGGLLVGQSVGYLSGLILTQSLTLEHSPFDLFLSTAAGSAIGSGAALLATGQSVRADATIVELGTLLGAIAALDATRRHTDPNTVAIGAALGAWFGGFAPVAYGEIDRETMSDEVIGGLLLGGTAGALASAIALEVPGLDPSEQKMAVVGSAAGAALGGGAMLLAPEAPGRTVAQVMLGSTAVGLFGGVLGLSRLPVERGDAAAASVAAGYGALTGLLLSDLLSSAEPSGRTRIGGALLMSSSLGTVTLMASDWLEMDVPDALEAGGYGGAGAVLGHGLAGLSGTAQRGSAALVLGAGTLALGAGLWAAGDTHYDGDDAANVAVPTLLGSSLGFSLPYVLRANPSDRERVAGVELMSGLGFAAGVIGSQWLHRPGADALETATFATSGGALGLGLGLLIPDSSSRARASLHQVGTLSLGIAAHALAPYTEYDALESSVIAVSAAQAAWAGLWLPYLWHGDEAPPGEEVLGGVLLGSGAGAIGGAIMTELLGVRPNDASEVVEISFYGIAANATGAGLGLLASDDNRITVAFLESFGLLGTAGLATLAPRTTFSDGDTALEVLWTSQSLWNGAALASLLEAEERQAAGAALLSVGAGGLLGAGLAQFVEPDVPDAFLAFTGSVWGVWLGYFGAVLAEQAGSEGSNKARLASALVASDIGLALTSFALSPMADMSPEQLGWINVSGLGGGVAGATFGLVAGGTPGVNPGNVIGCATGLVGGAIITALVMDDVAPAKAPPPTEPGAPKAEIAPTMGRSAGWGSLLPEISEVQVGSLMLPPRFEGEQPPLGLGVSGKLF